MGGRHLEQDTLKICKQICIFRYQDVVTRNLGTLEVDLIESSSPQARKIENAHINIHIYMYRYTVTLSLGCGGLL